MNDHRHDPTHDAPDDDLQALQAVSAYVDGTASPAERLQVESSDELRELAAVWASQRDELLDLDEPDELPPARARALDAALAVYDEIHAPAAPGTAPGAVPIATSVAGGEVLRFERRRRQQRWLVGAAAAVGVLFVGGIVATNGSRSQDETTSGAEVAATREADAELDTMIAESAPADAAVTEAAPGGAAVPMTEAAADEPVFGATEATEAPGTGDAAASTAASTAADDLDLAGPAEVVVSLTSPDALLDFAAARTAQLPLPGLPFPCVDEASEALGLADYRGTDVVVVRDPDSGEVRAIELATCDTVASAQP